MGAASSCCTTGWGSNGGGDDDLGVTFSCGGGGGSSGITWGITVVFLRILIRFPDGRGAFTLSASLLCIFLLVQVSLLCRFQYPSSLLNFSVL